MKAIVLACALALAGCAAGLAAVVPAASCVATVFDDALKGMTIQQIVAAAGPGCVTNAEEVIAILMGSADPDVKGTAAYREALTARGAKP